MMRRLVLVMLAWAMTAGAPPSGGASEGDGPPLEPGLELDLVSFNIRYGTAADGENAWEHRRDMVTGLLARLDADLVGLQEALRFQLDEIGAALPGYAEIGVGRDDGCTRGEYSALLVKTARFAIDASGTFWLSDTPEQPGSTSWGNGITRVCTWARLVEKASGRGVYAFNCHLDHQSQPSRERAVELLAERIADRAHPDEAVILMGDLNAGEDNPALRYLRAESQRASDPLAWPGHEPAGPPGLVDTFRAAHPGANAAGTFNGFRPAAAGGERVDHILVSAGVEVLEAGIDRTSEAGRYPSDHFPVTATVRF